MIEEYEGYLLERSAMMLVRIKAKGKGSVVKALRGHYTTATEAKKAIDKVLSEKGKVNGKAKSTD